MKEEEKFLGCFVSGPALNSDATVEQEKEAEIQGALFRRYIWGEEGISILLKKLKKESYGNDIEIILFQFYVNPIPYELEHLREIESYRKSEKSIGIPIIINDINFFNKSEKERYQFLKESILQKMDLLSEVVKKRKLDTNMDVLKNDLQEILEKITV